MQLHAEKKKFQLPIHIAKRLDISKKTSWIIRIVGFLAAFLLVGVFTTILKPGTFVDFYKNMFLGVFDPSDPDMIMGFLETVSIFLLLALALLPAFKMKYWNIGAEGAATMGCLITALITSYCPESMNSFLVIILAIAASMLAGMIWSFIPAFFKAKFNTNETLFTLMLNYVAIFLTQWVIDYINRGSSGKWGIITNHQLPDVFGLKYVITIIIVIVVTVLMWIYIKKTKHGYEISVVGGSPDTARYIGINKGKVIMRTLILSGALCGLAGFLIVAGRQHTLTSTMLNSRGFTAVLIAWLGHFEPAQVILFSVLIGFFDRGAFNAASFIGIDSNIFAGIVTGLFFLVVVASEFFTSYKILKRKKDDSNGPPKIDNKNKKEAI